MGNILKSMAVSAAILLFSGGAHAGLVDFAEHAKDNEHGVSDGDSETVGGFNIEFDATKSGDPEGYAYFDDSNNTANDHAGLGVCGTLNDNDACVPGDDDNLTLGETVTLTFDFVVEISGLFFGDELHHDVVGTDTLVINGQDLTFAAASGMTFIGQTITFGYGGNSPSQYYVSAMNVVRHVENVPAPAALSLIGLGLMGVGAARRRRRTA